MGPQQAVSLQVSVSIVAMEMERWLHIHLGFITESSPSDTVYCHTQDIVKQ